jgi:hypothetical protein
MYGHWWIHFILVRCSYLEFSPAKTNSSLSEEIQTWDQWWCPFSNTWTCKKRNLNNTQKCQLGALTRMFLWFSSSNSFWTPMCVLIITFYNLSAIVKLVIVLIIHVLFLKNRRFLSFSFSFLDILLFIFCSLQLNFKSQKTVTNNNTRPFLWTPPKNVLEWKRLINNSVDKEIEMWPLFFQMLCSTSAFHFFTFR